MSKITKVAQGYSPNVLFYTKRALLTDGNQILYESLLSMWPFKTHRKTDRHLWNMTFKLTYTHTHCLLLNH